jgi:hypothetical protein
MPSYIPASGCTLHLVGVCVNRIGTVRIFNQVYDFDAQTVLDDAIVPIRLTHTPTTYRFRGVNRRVAYGRSRPHRIGIPAIAS